jgi:DNA end-binding protein Ku
MIEEEKIAVAQMVWHGKEKVVVLRPVDGLLAMSTLSFEAEITKASAFTDQVPKVPIGPDELKMSKTLIAAATPKSFDFAKYKDTYTEKLTQLIEAKVSGKELVVPPPQEHAQIINLMDALKQSVAKLQGQEPAEGKPEPKMAASKKRAGGERKKKSS